MPSCHFHLYNRSTGFKLEIPDYFLVVYIAGWGVGLLDIWNGGANVKQFSQTTKYSDQLFQRPQIIKRLFSEKTWQQENGLDNDILEILDPK